MTFSPDINLGHLITLALALVGFIAGYVTLKIKTGDVERRQETLTGRLDTVERQYQDTKLNLSENYVKRTDLRDVEDRLVRSIEKIESSVREAIATALGRRPNP